MADETTTTTTEAAPATTATAKRQQRAAAKSAPKAKATKPAEPKPAKVETPALSKEERLANRPVLTLALIDASAALTEVHTPILTWDREFRHIANAREAGAHMLATMALSEAVRFVILQNGEFVEDVPTTFATLRLRKSA